MRDASLDEFVGDAGDDTGGGAGERGDADRAEGSDEAVGGGDADGRSGDDGGDAVGDPDEVATVTYEWTPGGASCANCASVVEARWRDEQGLVCEECKRW